MPACPKCGQPVRGEICPNCKTPLPSVSRGKAAAAEMADNGNNGHNSEETRNIYEGFLNDEEVGIFNQYLRLIQSGLLEVVAMDSLGTEHNLEQDDIKSIVKRGLKALQQAQERARKEAEQKARQLARDSKKVAKQETRNIKKAQKQRARELKRLQQGKPARRAESAVFKKLADKKKWLAVAGCLLILLLGFTIYNRGEEGPEPPAPGIKPIMRDFHYLRQGRVACYSQEDMELITRYAQNREHYSDMLYSGRCFVNRGEIYLTQPARLQGNIMRGFDAGKNTWLYFHSDSLRRENAPVPALAPAPGQR